VVDLAAKRKIYLCMESLELGTVSDPAKRRVSDVASDNPERSRAKRGGAPDYLVTIT